MRLLTLSLLAVVAAACSSSEEPIGRTSSALTDADPVSLAVTESCTTASVKGLSTQLVDEIQCLRPGTMKRIDGAAGLDLGSAVFPWLQAPAADAVIAAQKDRGVPLAINSALRTLPQQYLLYRWYQAGRCGIGLAARPGRSNHESGLAVDVEDDAAWRQVMAAHDMKWLGASDPVHFDYVGEGRADLEGLSVLAFQRLWNRNHPEDRIAEDSAYGDETEERLARGPVGGFAKGADCSGGDGGAGAPSTPTEPDGGGGGTPAGARSLDGGEGCAATPRRSRDGWRWALGVIAVALAGISRRGSGGSAPRGAHSRRTR